MNAIYGNDKLSSETCYLLELELRFNLQSDSKSLVILGSACRACQSPGRQTNNAPSVYSAPYYCPAAKQ